MRAEVQNGAARDEKHAVTLNPFRACVCAACGDDFVALRDDANCCSAKCRKRISRHRNLEANRVRKRHLKVLRKRRRTKVFAERELINSKKFRDRSQDLYGRSNNSTACSEIFVMPKVADYPLDDFQTDEEFLAYDLEFFLLLESVRNGIAEARRALRDYDTPIPTKSVGIDYSDALKPVESPQPLIIGGEKTAAHELCTDEECGEARCKRFAIFHRQENRKRNKL